MKWSIQLGRLMGIPIRLHITFVIILLMFIYYFASISYKYGTFVLGFNALDTSFDLKLVFSAVASILFFSTILFHELSHSYVAKQNGLNIQSITLFVFGGVAQMEEIPRNPKLELKMAAAGPIISLFIGVISYLIYKYLGPVILNNNSMDFGLLEPNIIGASLTNALLITLGIVSFYNIVLAIFNLIPAFPMDGGRILRALLAFWLPYLEATRTAVAIGKMLAVFMAFFGFFYMPFLIFIAFLIFYGASGEEKETILAISLEGLKVKDVMTSSRDMVYIPPSWTISQLVEIMFKTKHMGYPVQEGMDSLLKGIITFHDVQKVPKDQHDNVKVEDIMTKEIISVDPDDEAYFALQTLAKNRIGRLLVIRDGRIEGIVTMKDIMRQILFRDMYSNTQ
ncbi:MAG: CBS domain-containing protein [Methanosarcinales archaeon]|nr:CBS domain-containing protein [Methanosarcinales archaeon]